MPWSEWSLLGGAAVFYAALATETVQGGDSGELTAVAATLGVAHPPGYPLFTLLGHLTAQLPIGTVAWRVALVSALAAAWTLFALARTLRLLAVSRASTAIATTAFGLASTFVFLAGVAEVFTLNTAIASSLLLIAALLSIRFTNTPTPNRPPFKIAFALGLTVGLGVTNHHTIIFAFPLCIAAGIELFRISARKRFVVAALIAGLILGVTPTLYLLAAGGGSGWPRWGNTDTLEGLARHLLRADYGTFSLGLLRGDDSAWDHIGRHLSRGFAELGPAVLLLAIIGAVTSIRVSAWRMQPFFIVAALAVWVLSGPLFHAFFNIPIDGFGDEISARFDLMPHLVLVVFAAFGLDAVLRALSAQPPFRLPRVALVVGLISAITLQAVLNVPAAIPRRHTLAENYGRDTIALLPPNALLFIDGDRDFSVLTYLQEVARERRDMRVVHVALLGHRWYVDELRRRDPTLQVPFQPGRALSRDVMASAHATGRRVFVTQGVAAQMKRGDRLVPFGVVVELLSDSAATPRPDELEAQQRAIADRVASRQRQTAPLRAGNADIPSLYLSGYKKLRDAFAQMKDVAAVQRVDIAIAELANRFPATN